MNKERKALIIILFIAISLRLLLFISVGSWQDNILNDRILGYIDAYEYHKIAINLIQNHVFSVSESAPFDYDARRVPVYPSFLALLYVIFGFKPYIAILFQIIIGSLTCVCIYKIGELVFNDKIAFLAGLLSAAEYSNILYNNQLLSETLFTFLFIVQILFLVKFLKFDSNRALFYSAIFLGLATLCRPVSIYFFVFLTGVFFIHYRENLRKGILKYILLVLVFIAAITPWMSHNYIVHGKFLVSSQQEDVLKWNFPYSSYEVYYKHKEQDQNQGSNYSKPGNEAQEISAKKKIINAVLVDTSKYVKDIFRYFIVMGSSSYYNMLGLTVQKVDREDWHKGPWEILKIAVKKKSSMELLISFLGMSFLLYLYTTMFFGIYTAIREKKYLEIVLFVSIIMYFAIASAPTGSYRIRYRVPIMPYIILFSSYGMIQLQYRLSEYRMKRNTVLPILYS